MKRYEFNKLVRHKLPPRMQVEGVKVNGKQLDEDEYKHELKRKLMEEAQEVMDAASTEQLKRELGDVLEVVHALAFSYNISLDEIEKERLHKREINGYFSPENYINYIEVSLEDKKVIDYLEKDDRDYKFER